ncbi:hypothetical protein [Streptomyces sp. NPDC054865]
MRAGMTPLALPAGSLPGPRRGLVGRSVRRTAVAARTMAFTVLTMVAVVFGTPMATAEAAPFGLDCIGVQAKGNWGPEFYGSASTVLIPSAQPEWGPDPKPEMSKKTLAANYTLYELTNGRGLLWSTYKKDAAGDDKCSIMDVAGNWMAQTIFEHSKSLGSFSLGIQDLAMNTAPFQDLYQGKDGEANSMVAKLYATIWAPLGTVMITLCGAWVVVHGRAKSRSKVWQGLGGMAASLIVSALLLQGSWYTTLTSEADKSINGLSSAMTEVMLPDHAGSKSADPCWLAEGVPNRAKRTSSCTMYKAMMFTPWAAGQYGQDANAIIDSGWKGDSGSGWKTEDCSLGYRCTDIRTAQVMAQTFTRADDLKSLVKKGDDFERVAKQMAKDDRKARFNDWRGSNPSSRMQVALASGVSNLILAPSVDIVALFKLFWEGFILVLIIMLPIVGAVAAFPPATFVAREWGNAFTIAFVLKGIAWVGLTLLLAIYGMILSSSASLGVQVLMIIMVAAGLWHFTIKTMKGAKRSADQAFQAKAAYEEVTDKAGSFAKRQAGSLARKGLNHFTGDRAPSPRAPRTPKTPPTNSTPQPSRRRRNGNNPAPPQRRVRNNKEQRIPNDSPKPAEPTEKGADVDKSPAPSTPPATRGNVPSPDAASTVTKPSDTASPPPSRGPASPQTDGPSGNKPSPSGEPRGGGGAEVPPGPVDLPAPIRVPSPKSRKVPQPEASPDGGASPTAQSGPESAPTPTSAYPSPRPRSPLSGSPAGSELPPRSASPRPPEAPAGPASPPAEEGN